MISSLNFHRVKCRRTSTSILSAVQEARGPRGQFFFTPHTHFHLHPPPLLYSTILIYCQMHVIKFPPPPPPPPPPNTFYIITKMLTFRTWRQFEGRQRFTADRLPTVGIILPTNDAAFYLRYTPEGRHGRTRSNVVSCSRSPFYISMHTQSR